MKYQTPDEDHGYGELMDSVDGIVMGRRTFETVLGFDQSPYPKPVVVLSHTAACRRLLLTLARRCWG
jgi:dihydrofolate reductase